MSSILKREEFAPHWSKPLFWSRPLFKREKHFLTVTSLEKGGWSGGAKVLCILHHWGVQLILAYSWARPAILVQM